MLLAATFFSEAFDWLAKVSSKLPQIDYKTYFIVVIAAIILTGLIVGLTFFGSYRFKLTKACKRIIKYLSKVDSIDDDNVSDFTAQCFSAKAPSALRDSWIQYLGVRFGYPSDIVSESSIFDKTEKKLREIRANIFIAIALVLVAIFAFWGYGTLDGKDMGVIFLASLALSAVIYLVLVILNKLMSKVCLDRLNVMQEDLDAKVNLQIEKSYATDSSPLAELAAMVDVIIARNTAKDVGFEEKETDEDELTPIDILISEAEVKQREDGGEGDAQEFGENVSETNAEAEKADDGSDKSEVGEGSKTNHEQEIAEEDNDENSDGEEAFAESEAFVESEISEENGISGESEVEKAVPENAEETAEEEPETETVEENFESVENAPDFSAPVGDEPTDKSEETAEESETDGAYAERLEDAETVEAAEMPANEEESEEVSDMPSETEAETESAEENAAQNESEDYAFVMYGSAPEAEKIKDDEVSGGEDAYAAESVGSESEEQSDSAQGEAVENDELNNELNNNIAEADNTDVAEASANAAGESSLDSTDNEAALSHVADDTEEQSENHAEEADSDYVYIDNNSPEVEAEFEPEDDKQVVASSDKKERLGGLLEGSGEQAIDGEISENNSQETSDESKAISIHVMALGSGVSGAIEGRSESEEEKSDSGEDADTSDNEGDSADASETFEENADNLGNGETADNVGNAKNVENSENAEESAPEENSDEAETENADNLDEETAEKEEVKSDEEIVDNSDEEPAVETEAVSEISENDEGAEESVSKSDYSDESDESEIENTEEDSIDDEENNGGNRNDGTIIKEVADEEDDEERIKPAKLFKLPNLVDYMLSINPSRQMKINIATILLSAYGKFKNSDADRKIVVDCMKKLMASLTK